MQVIFPGEGGQFFLNGHFFFLGWCRGGGAIVQTFFWVQVYSRTLKKLEGVSLPDIPLPLLLDLLLNNSFMKSIYIFFAWCNFGPLIFKKSLFVVLILKLFRRNSNNYFYVNFTWNSHAAIFMWYFKTMVQWNVDFQCGKTKIWY